MATTNFVDETGSIDSLWLNDVDATVYEALGGAITASAAVTALGLLQTKVIEIGDWDMDATSLVAVAHGLTLGNIRSVIVTIIADTGALNGFPSLSATATSDENIQVGGTSVQLTRGALGFFDSANYDTTSYNRGWIVIQYIS